MLRVHAAAVAVLFAAPLPAAKMANVRLGHLPLAFEEVAPGGKQQFTHSARGSRGTFYFGATDIAWVSNSSADIVRMQLAGADSCAAAHAEGQTEARTNYLIGNDPSLWRTNVPQYSRLAFDEIYPGIDLVYYGNDNQLEYDFIVKPGADPSKIRLRLRGAGRLRIDESGDAVIVSPHGTELREKRPVVYQTIDGRKVEIAGRYRMTGRHELGFVLGAYDRSAPLVIDPGVGEIDPLGGSGSDQGNGIAVDPTGVFVVGTTNSTNIQNATPLGGPIQNGTLMHVFVTKFDPTATKVLFTTIIGGNGTDIAIAVATDGKGTLYFTGVTGSPNYPTTTPDSILGGGGDTFITALNPTGGSIAYSTVFGGSGFDVGNSIAVDPLGQAYITGSTASPNFPVLNAAQPSYGGAGDAFLVKLSPSGARMFATFFGGVGPDDGNSVVLGNNSVYIGGDTTISSAAPDAFLARFSPSGQFMQVQKFGGSGNDYVSGMAIDPNSGDVILAGGTGSPGLNILGTPFLSPPSASGLPTGFAAIVDPTLTKALFATYLPAGANSAATSVAVDPASGAIFLAESIQFTVPTATNSLCPGTTDHTALVTLPPVPILLAPPPGLDLFRDLGCADGDIVSVAFGAGSIYFATGAISSNPSLPFSNRSYGGGVSDGVILSGPLLTPSVLPMQSTDGYLIPPTVNFSSGGLLPGDFDGNGAIDGIFLNTGNGTLNVVKDITPGTLLPTPITVNGFPPATFPTDVTSFIDPLTGRTNIAFGDVGNPTGTGQSQLVVGVNNGTTTTFFTVTLTPIPGNTTNIASGDFNNDGSADLLFTDITGDAAVVMLNNGSNGYTAPPIIAPVGTMAPVSLAIGDVNGDDNMDAVVLGITPSNQSVVAVLSGVGDGSFGLPVSFPVPNLGLSLIGGQVNTVYGGISGTQVFDLNNDGAPDFVVASTNGGSQLPADPSSLSTSPVVSVLLSSLDKPGTFVVQPPVTLFPHALPGAEPRENEPAASAADAPEAGPPSAVTATTPKFPMAAADFDGDGNWDLAIANPRTNVVTLLRGDGKGHLTPASSYLVGQTPIGLKVADVNKDGMPDLIVTCAGSRTIHLLVNRTPPPAVRSPLLSARGVTNAASFKSGGVSPGEIVTFFGANMGPANLAGLQLDASGKLATQVAGTQVLFDGVPAPLIYVSANQLSAIVPYSVEKVKNTQIQVVYQGRVSNTIARPVVSTRPAIFTQQVSGSGPGAILNQDFSINTAANPAERGSAIQIFGTGEGQTSPPGVDGLLATTVFPAPVQKVTVTIAGVPADVIYGGAAPTLVAGVLQVNALVPAGVTPGPSVPVVVSVGGVPSQSGVTVSIK